MTVIENQKVEVKWNPRNKQHFTSIVDNKGRYKYPDYQNRKTLLVDIEDLLPASRAKITLKCDYCEIEFFREWCVHLNSIATNKVHGLSKDSCPKCRGLKIKEVYGYVDDFDITPYEPSDLKKYTENELIEEYFRFKNQFGYYPNKVDIEAKRDFPSASAYCSHWGTWSNFIKSLNIMSEDGWYHDDEDVVKKVYPIAKNLHEINEKLSTPRPLKQINRKAEQFGYSVKNFINIRNYKTYNNQVRLESSMLGIQDLHKDLGRCPTALEYDNYARTNNLISRRNLTNRCNKTYSEICKDILNDSNKLLKSDKELLDDLKSLKIALGRTPLANELKDNGLAEKKMYTRRFNMSYQKLIESLGWELSTPALNFKSDEELLTDYKNLYLELGRIPNHKDLDDSSYTVNSQTYRLRFGKYTNILKKLNISYEINQDMSSGIVSISKNKEICKSIPELEISNLLFDNNIKYISEVKYSTIKSNLKTKWVMDWYLPEEKTCVEYFGLYDKISIFKNNRTGKYSRKADKKIDICREEGIKLIALFKEDLENQMSGLIKKFNEAGIPLRKDDF